MPRREDWLSALKLHEGQKRAVSGRRALVPSNPNILHDAASCNTTESLRDIFRDQSTISDTEMNASSKVQLVRQKRL